MVNLLKNRFSLYTFTTALLFLTHHIDAKVQDGAIGNAGAQVRSGVNGKTQNNPDQFSCNINSTFFRCKDGNTHGFSNKTYQKTDKNTHETVAIQASGKNTVLVGEDITVKDASSAVSSKENFWKYGVVASENGKVTIERGGINFTNGIGVEVRSWGKVVLKSVSITEKGGQGMRIDDHSENLAFHASGSGFIHFEKGKVNLANAHGFSMHGNNINGNGRFITIVDSTVSVESNRSYGLRFWEGPGDRSEEMKDHENPYPFYIFTGEKEMFGSLPKKNLPVRGLVDLTRTSFTVPNSAAIYSRKSGGVVRLLDNSKLSGDLLLKVEDGSFVKVSVDASTLVGGTRIDESSSAEFRLKDSSKWILSRPKNKNLQVPHSIGVSSISLIHLVDSSIAFEQPETNIVDGYQTLRVGRGTGEVYNARGKAHLYLNTYLNKGGALQNQKTDRLLVHGDVKGKTMVHVRAISGSPGGGTERYGNDKGISIIQVSGRAEKDSFLLDGDYIALDGLPYQYRLHAYGPSSELGRASASQRLVEGEGDFWDFRLENGSIDSNTTFRLTQGSKFGLGGERHSRQGVKVVVPQVPTYLLLPNSLLQAGLMDISNQNKQLETQRANPRGMLEIPENPASFLRGYGGNYRYASDLSALEYGYGGDLGYYALEAGVLLQKIENVESVISFGVMGSYGKLSLQPKDVEQSQKSAFDKWTATVYGSMQHDTGFYIDGLLSYGLFKGDVLTPIRGKTATLKGNPLSLSLMSGQKITTGYEGVVFNPQAQVVYQYLQFNETRDIDNFNIEMDKFDQWMVRIGGRLTKTLAAPEKDRDVSFYGKVHFAHDFGKERSVRFKDSFQLGAFGSSLEAGLGLNARLSQKFAFHGDLVYQHKLSKGGFSGISFSGGLRYRF
ncbi:autotransporter outer membrane beta-barrel domain-containing protein [Bartonella tribocorum]|uniref:Autotransporter n=1 Tax=Bartonella tribocorum (strain DSM 28219 / CCUG 45778 / CIP 105476 / IBS 506) TaxID=382640 RepID=A9IWZ0_BART1|nr:autotransporter outer membrane beta-barrel domain-containing protein [Bartonella tribocorum]CAK02072.1 putative autotransporter [Bartonella tribocorum CIP 105476]CDO49336.1 autotransporter [Bartonella tribocorum]